MTAHLCRSGLPWLMEPVPGQQRLVYLCICGRTLADPTVPAIFGDIERNVRAVTRQLQTIADNAAAEWRAGQMVANGEPRKVHT